MKSKVSSLFIPKTKIIRAGKANFKKRMKTHYKGEFNMAALLKRKPPPDEDDDDDDK